MNPNTIDIDAGALRHRIRLQETISTTQGADGHVTPTPIKKDEVWAMLEPLSGRELWQAQQTKATVTHRVQMRYRRDMDPRWQFKFGERTFQIESAINVLEANVKHVLMATELV